MNNIDQRIQAALEQASELPEHLDEPSITEELIATFQGNRRWLLVWAGVKMVASVVIMLTCIVLFFQQESMMAMIAYAAATLLCAIAYATIFLLLWIQMNHNNTTREVKRLELQIALLKRELQTH